MPAVDTLTFDDDPPHRAALVELGGAGKENSAEFPPNAVKHPTAQEFNQYAKQIAAFNRMTPLARLFVRFSAGAPVILAVHAPGSTLVTADFTPIDNADGDTTIWWTTGTGGKLPSAVGVGALTVTEDLAVDEQRAILTSSGGNPAVRVVTKVGGVATDASFTVEIY